MQHTVEDISPVKKKVSVSVPADEVDAVLNRTVVQYRSRVSLPGFRKGKVPLVMVEKRFAQDIYDDAVNELVSGNVDAILKELDLEPLGSPSFEKNDAPLARGKDFSYEFSVEVMPPIVLPAYEGIGVEEEPVAVDDAEIDEVVNRLRRGMAEREDVAEKRLPRDGDIVVMDFAGFDESGQPVEGVSGENFQVSLGDDQVIPDFEALTKTILPGDSGEGEVVFPEDYNHVPLAGKTVTMKITVKSLQTRKLPEIDGDFAQKASGLESVDAMRNSIRASYTRNRKEMAKAKAQSLLLEKLLGQTGFPLPEGMVARYTQNILHGKFEDLEHKGQEASSVSEEEFAAMQKDARAEAEQFAKTQMFLLTVAKRENLEVSVQEMNAALRQIAARSRRDFKEIQEHYARNNLFPALRERIVADKAMDLIYEKANPNPAPDLADAGDDGEKAAGGEDAASAEKAPGGDGE
ncbi:MAG: trigger factor [Deltaproteobacteria bacterium]|jgi:trigger factor|nr:trigger factor [Deltaproteobacteria bacterium]